uniref:Uncharacterized protein n=1 Tax=Gracilaria caudata TaxID=2572395 RepID=A0A345U6X9_9FLOR|nr:hypothetical protein [Gracilaria caudata]AXI96215.1 hypothetical protein [Gracilaria caudata]
MFCHLYSSISSESFVQHFNRSIKVFKHFTVNSLRYLIFKYKIAAIKSKNVEETNFNVVEENNRNDVGSSNLTKNNSDNQNNIEESQLARRLVNTYRVVVDSNHSSLNNSSELTTNKEASQIIRNFVLSNTNLSIKLFDSLTI